jgi:hypothetical protein
MSTLLNPRHSATYDATADRIVISFRDGRDASVIELDPEAVPGLINALMEARRVAKQAKAPVPIPPPMVRPPCPAPVATSSADHTPIRRRATAHPRVTR